MYLLTNLLKLSGTILLIKSDLLKQKYLEFKREEYSLDVEKKILLEEVENTIRYEKDLLKRLKKSEIEKFYTLKQEYEYVVQQRRQLEITMNSIEHIPKYEKLSQHNILTYAAQNSTTAMNERPWTDVFNEFAKRNNELWRNDLLSQALAKEMMISKSVSLKAIWTIGMLEEDTFESLALFMDICSTIDGYPLIAPSSNEIDDETLPIYNSDKVSNFSDIYTHLSEHNLVSYMDVNIKSTEPVEFNYGGRECTVTTDADWLELKCYCLTDIGMEIFWLYKQNINDIGLKYYEQLHQAFNENKEIKICQTLE